MSTSQLRMPIVAELRSCLDRPPLLRSGDFTLWGGSGLSTEGGEMIEIRYLMDERYRFVVSVDPNKKANYSDISGDRLQCDICPGKLTTSERTICWGFESLTKQVKAWVWRIEDEIKRSAEYRAISEQEARIADLEERLKSIPDEYATTEQVKHINAWLEQFAEETKAKIESLDLDAKEKAAKIEALEQELAVLRERLPKTKIRNWARAAITRLYLFASDERTGRLLENATKLWRLLGSGEPHDPTS